ncbi:LPXTG cell wall anchor domain-containing protein [Enterococcus mundtii]|uniref:LPXTG cell wall anchor domain-containing protein n=1 Tax=Enterococcus mundtii TaxID=53346 RepID=UPI0013702452|nr:LPXTG cell wall anchor domain-containing protein [Enterococcus mundtii]MZZ58243.1 LPXTG cell wall anchor domain-containing protein [Enterococcus mundtii]
MAKKKDQMKLNKPDKEMSKKQKRMIEAGALLTVGAGAFIGGVTIPNLSASADSSSLSEKRLVEDETIQDIEHTSVDELNQSLQKGQSSSVKTNTGFVAKLMDQLPSKEKLSSMYEGEGIKVSDTHTAYDIQQILGIKDADVYYQTSTLSTSDAQVMKMSSYRQLIQANPNVKVTSQDNYKTVSPHLYESKEKAYEDSANWKDSKVVASTREKSLSFSSKTKPESTNFTADDGAVLVNMKIDTGFSLNVKAENGQAKLTDEIKSDFEDAMEKNFSITYEGSTYYAVYHDESISTDHGKNQADGYFTFSSSTHGLPLEINGHYLVSPVQFGSTVDSLKTSLSLHGVRSFENTDSWLNTDESNINVKVNFVDQLADENTTYYEIQAKDQVIESLKYEYVTVSLDEQKATDSTTAYADEMSMPTYSGSQSGISPGGAVDGNLAEDAAGLAGWNQTATFSGGGYGGHTITANSAVTVKTGQVSQTNFSSVISTVNITVDGVSYNQFVAQPIMVNGVQYAGYLTGANGSGSDFTIVVKDTNFNIYQIGGEFAYISSSMTDMATPDATTPDATNPQVSPGTTTPEVDPGAGGGETTDPGTGTPEVDPGTGGETDPGTTTPEVDPGTGGGETDPGTGTPEVDPGTGGETDPGTGTPEVDPGTGGETDPGTTTPEVDPGTGGETTDPGTGGETDPGTTTPEVDPGTGGGETDPGTTTPEVDPGTGGETDPGTTTPEVDPGTGGETDPGTTTPEVDPGTGGETTDPGTGGETDPGTTTPEVAPGTGGETTDPGTTTPEVDPGTGEGETDPGTTTPEVDPGTGGETDPGTGTPEVDPGTGGETTDPGTGGETDPGTTTPEVDPGTGGETDPGTGTPEVDPGTGGGETDPGTTTPEVDPGTGGETDPGTGTPEVDPGTGGETDPGTGTPEVDPGTGGETDPGTGTPEVDPGTGGETDPGTTTPEVDPGTGGETNPGTGTPEVDPGTGGETDPATGTPEVDPGTGGGETDPGTGTPEVDPGTGGETDPGMTTPEVDPGAGGGETDPSTTTPEVNLSTGDGGETDLSSTTSTETTDTDNQVARNQVLSDNSSNDGLSSNKQTNDQTSNTQEISDSEDVSGKQLPKTGSSSGMFGKFVGGILVAFAGFFGLFKRNRRELQNDEDRVERVIKEEDEEQENKEENKDKK